MSPVEVRFTVDWVSTQVVPVTSDLLDRLVI